MTLKDYSGIFKFVYGSEAYNWGLLPNSKFVIECEFKSLLSKKRFVRMYDAEVITLPNGVVTPKNTKAKIHLSGDTPPDSLPPSTLIRVVVHFRKKKPFNTEDFVKKTLEEFKKEGVT